jgi:hypothetical protein
MKSKRTTARNLLSVSFLLGLTITCGLAAQTLPQTHPINPARPNLNHAAIESNPACQQIVQECQKLGFIVGQWKKDNGLWRDCFEPVVRGGTPTRDGRPIQVPVSASEIQSCRAAAHRK